MKKTLLYLAIILTSIFATSIMVVSTLSAPANADELKYDPSWGNADTAREKLFVDALYECLTYPYTTTTTWKYDMWWSYQIKPDDVSDGKWFHEGTVSVNPIVEETVVGKYEDGKINCDENDNALPPSVIAAINEAGASIDYKDLICDKTDEYVTGGILGRGNENTECHSIYDNSYDHENYYFEDSKTNDEQYEYLQAALGNGIFEPTGLEAYYMIHDAFITACTSGKASASNDSPTYTIKEIGPDNTMIEVGYSGKNKPGPDDKVPHIMLNGGDFGAGDDSTCRDLEEALNNNEYIDKYAEYLKTNGLDPDNPGDDSDSEQAEQNCQNSGGAGALGWIVCSILDWMSNATEHLYDNVVEPELRVEPQLFDQGKGALTAWEYFRNFANIIFTILVLIVIFSQLTGVGIDNYGIKKILPKLIIAAIIVNLSYLICIICVDLSNIIGNGAQALFNNIPTTAATEESINVSIDGNSQNVNINTGADVGIIAVGTVSAAVGAIAIYANPALLLTLFVAVLGVLISVLFIFILLAGRKAAIVLLTVLSPVAFILYMLPNTKKIFDKWFGLWKAMLLVYPICGLLIGGGNFASRLMLSVGDHSSAATIFTAMVVGIVPIFFIPAAIKGAYAAIGSVGGAIAGFGNRLRGGATNRMRNSNAYKNAQQMGLDRKTRKLAGINKQGDATRVGRLQRRIAGSGVGRLVGADRRMNARTKAAKKEMAEQEEAAATSMAVMAASEMGNTPDVMAVDGNGTLTGDKLFNAKRENYYASKFNQAAEKGDRKGMNAALAAAKSAGVRDKDIAKMVRHSVNSGALNGNKSEQMSMWLQGQAETNKALAKDIELQNWAASGGHTTLGGYGDYIASGNMSVNDLDKGMVANASTDSLAGLAKAGKLPQSIAREILHDESMQLSPDKRIILGAVADGKISPGTGVDAIKKAAENLSTGIDSSTGINAKASDAEKWTSPQPERVTIDQQEPNEIPVRVTSAQASQKPPVPDGYKETDSGIILPNK